MRWKYKSDEEAEYAARLQNKAYFDRRKKLRHELELVKDKPIYCMSQVAKVCLNCPFSSDRYCDEKSGCILYKRALNEVAKIYRENKKLYGGWK